MLSRMDFFFSKTTKFVFPAFTTTWPFLAPSKSVLERTNSAHLPSRPFCSLPSEPILIHSAKNPRVKEARTLLQRRQREKRGLILLEGQRLVSDAFNAGVRPQQVFVTCEAVERNSSIAQILEQVGSAGAEKYLVTESVMQGLTDTVTPQGVIAVCKRPSSQLPSNPTLLLVCDGVQDPGNLGTLLRSAAASGADAVATTAGSADVWGMKALRSGMGAHFHVPVVGGMGWDDLESYAAEHGLALHVASGTEGSRAHWSVDWCRPSGLVIGSEAFGASDHAMRAAHGHMVNIPMCANVESLNAGMAGTVILFEASRQRQQHLQHDR